MTNSGCGSHALSKDEDGRELRMNTKDRDGWIWTFWSQMRPKNQRQMRVVETLPLGGKRSLVLVECCGKSFFVGCGGDAVNCIYPAPFDAAPAEMAMPSQLGVGLHEEDMPCTL